MLDIQFIRDNPEVVQTAAKHKKVEVDISKVLELDEQVRELIYQVDQARQKRNEFQKEIKGKPSQEQIEQGKKLREEIANLESKLAEVEEPFQKMLLSLPNIPTEDTPIGKDEEENVVLRQVGEKTKLDFEAREHWELGETLGILDIERAAKVSGTRFAFLKGDLAMMQFALVQFVLQTLTNEDTLKEIIEKNDLKVSSRPFIPVVPPVMIRPEAFAKMDRLEPKEERYYIPSDDVYLIGSAEHTLGSMHMDEIFEESELPLRYIGYSTSFRREAGSYGKDTKGILRVHQFDKLEMESFTTPEMGLEEQHLFVAIQEYILQRLELPYQVLAICTGDMGRPDARQIDMETWMPGQNKYRETHTSDYMTDFQSRRLSIRYRGKDNQLNFVHMNDATAVAIGRTLIGIMENYQQADGSIRVPKVLQGFVGKEVIR